MWGTVRTEQLWVDPLACLAEWEVPVDAAALVLFDVATVDQLGVRRRTVTELLHQHHLATVLMLRPDDSAEAIDGRSSAGVERLGRQVERAVDWVAQRHPTADLRLGLFGAGSGAAAVLMAAAERPGLVRAVVSGGGEPDLGRHCLERIEAATLLVVGAGDREALARNRAALRLLHCPRRLEALPATTQRFAEPGALESVAELAATWYDHHLVRRPYA